MRKLNLPTSKMVIEKTGLPFYDAARLIGAAHVLSSTTSVDVEDQGGHWILRTPKLIEGRRRQQLLWVLREFLPPQTPTDEPGRKKQPGKKQAAYGRVEAWVQSMSISDNREATKTKAYDFLDAAFQSGIRGYDPLRSYGKLASASSSMENAEDSEFNIYAATFGASFGAVSRGGRNESGEWRVWPVLGGEDNPIVLGPFLDFRHSYQHEAGGFVAAVWASLALLEELVGQDLPVVDFAYNSAPSAVLQWLPGSEPGMPAAQGT
jgi:hypothetical protein